eukprot:CAMPEP_0206433836 /NCGR_PEP_ID=MMETSP0324_2-20121206/8762_1 /ASSEMBLY_ACC=CAM_ASM_000836 /TAXON_ID=2866 /ORGANISM="Crypthecodinium cohnii, Strain Seligo" /LENGTH=243 /DNA_ID=CAMNT_0053900161 /DNA_START=105 /DNA_END=840 /DNA_ORIENTATION=+
MFEFDDLEDADPTSTTAAISQVDKALFEIQKQSFPMKLPQPNMTAADVMEIWEHEWGILYASRLRFAAPEGSSVKWLNAHGHSVPPAPAVVRLEGALEAENSVRVGLDECCARLPVEAHVLAAGQPAARPPKATLGPVERAQLKHYVNALNRRSGKFGQGHSHGRLFGQPSSEEDQLRMEREEYLQMQAERRKQEDRAAREEAERQRRSHHLSAAAAAAAASQSSTGPRRAAYEEHRDMWNTR